ncbi:MAG TPA: MFS transporter [Spirochaetota bacterium]|nr:MFS transporter [Spirochaetota bacterium]
MKFNYGKIFLLGFGSFGFSAVWFIYNSFVPLFLQERFLMAPAMIGFFMTLDNIAALFIQPPMGAWSDRVRTRIGRRMPFIILGIPVAATAFVFVPLAPILPLFAVCTGTFILSMAIWRTPVVALLADITPSANRSQANGITNFMGGIGGIIAALGGGALFAMNHAYPFWLGSCLVVLAGGMLFAFIREPREYESNFEEKPELWANLKIILRDRERSALRIFLAHFFWFIALNAIEAFFTLYAKNHLGYPGEHGSRILGQFLLTLVLFALPAGIIGGKIGRKRSIMLGLSVLMVTLLTIFFLDREVLTIVLTTLPVLGSVPVVGGLLMICGIAWMMVNVNSLPMVVDMTDGLRAGTYTGIYYLFITAAAIAGPNINGWIIQLSGSDYSSIYISSAVFVGIAFIMMLGVRRGEARSGHSVKVD